MYRNNLSDYHFQYLDVTQHWHDQSEEYAGGDALLTFLYDGWKAQERVFYEQWWFAGMRSVVVYYFELTRGDETLTMPVVNNPYVARLVVQLRLRAIHKEHDDAIPSRTDLHR